MAEYKLDGLFLEGGTNLQYFTKVNWWRSERTFGAVFSQKRDPVWVCPGFERQRRKSSSPRDKRYGPGGARKPICFNRGVMKDLGAGGGRLGLDPSMRNFIYFGLRRDGRDSNLSTERSSRGLPGRQDG